jgi:creatinine amidohydrolase
MHSEDFLDSEPGQLGHGGERETSLVMLFRPDLVDLGELEPLPAGEGPYYAKTVEGTWYTIDWIRQVPKGYVGIPHVSSARKGALMAEAGADACAEIVRAIKAYSPGADR